MTAADNRELGAPAAALRIDQARLDDYLREHIAGYAGGGNVRQFLGGQSNPTYLIEDTSGTYVLRKKPPGKLLPSAHAVDREFRVISALRDAAVPVPTAYLLCEDESIIGAPFQVMDRRYGIVIRDRKCSTSYIQRKLAIGYNKAARLVEQMEDSGLVSAANHVGKREILVPEQA